MEVKHVIWMDGELEGRLAVGKEKSFIVVKKIAGSNLPANYLFCILDAAIPGWRQEAEELHLGRRNAWFVETRQGRWGSLTFLLKIIRDVELLDVPTVACLHVSNAGKLTDRIELWLGDLAPLAAALRENFPQAVLPSEEYEESYYPFWCETPGGGYLKLRVVDPQPIPFDRIRFGGEPSGLLEEPEEQPQAPEPDSVPEVEVI